MQGVHELFATLPGDQQKVDDGIPADARQSLHGTNRAAFDQHPNRHLALTRSRTIASR